MTGQLFENLQKKWFAAANPINKAKATATLGTGDNGVITITADDYGTAGNDFSVEVVVAEGNDKAMAAAIESNKITVTLGTGAEGAVDNTKNTAVLISAAIAALTGVTAAKSGTGADSLTEAVAEADFTGGQWATPCKVVGTLVKDTTYYYICETAGSKETTVWKRFTLDAY